MTKKEALIQKRKKLVGEKNRKIDSIKRRYRILLEPIREELRSIRASKPSIDAAQKYIEPTNSPKRKCLGCGETLLRATVENAQRVVNLCNSYISGELHYKPFHVKKIRENVYCCHICRIKDGKGHSNWCSSATQVRFRERNIIPEKDSEPIDE